MPIWPAIQYLGESSGRFSANRLVDSIRSLGVLATPGEVSFGAPGIPVAGSEIV
jgi:hypothetical protein